MKFLIHRIAVCLLLFFSASPGMAASDKAITYRPEPGFIENHGQFDAFSGNHLPIPSSFAYLGDGENIFFYQGGFSIQLVKRYFRTKSEELRQKRRAQRLAGFKTREEFLAFEREGNLIQDSSVWLHYSFVGALPGHVLMGSEVRSATHSYLYLEPGGKRTPLNNLKAYNKVIYKNIYQGVDAVFEFHPAGGFEYSFFIREGGEINDIKLQCNVPSMVNAEGVRIIQTPFGEVKEHPAKAWYTEDKQELLIESSGDLQQRSFVIPHRIQNKAITIDPWIQTPSFNTNWDCVWECERDAAGNVYIIGGVMPMQLIKYNSAGALQWTYNTPYDTAGVWLGTFATDLAGNSYITSGSTAAIQMVNTAGALVWDNPNPGGIFSNTEFWSIAFNCDQSKMLIGGTGGFINPEPWVFDVDMSSGNVISSVQVTGPGALIGIPPNTNEVRAVTATRNNKYYFLTHDSIGYISDDLGLCPNTDGPFHVVNDNYNLSYKCENWRYDNSGIEALAYFDDFIFVNRGNRLDKIAFGTAQVLQSVTIPGGGFVATFGQNQVRNSGIDIDACGTIYVGSVNAVHSFDQNLNLLNSFPVSFSVYDVAVNINGEVLACGSTGNSSSSSRIGTVQSIAASACIPNATVCCDASVCPPPSLCINDAPFQLTPNSAGGTWSGTGVSASGVFNPAATGAGTFVITYTQPCGSDSLTIVVNPCSALSVCIDTAGILNVSGGSAPYTWSYFQPATTINISNQAQCQACGYTWVFGTCLNGIFPVTTCNSPASWITWATGPSAAPPPLFPAQVQDNAGTVFTIDSLGALPLCSACPASLGSVQQIQEPLCNGANGSALIQTDPTVSSVIWQPGNLSGASQAALPAGSYQVILSDGGTCSDTLALNMNEPALLSLGNVETDSSTCAAANGLANLSFSGGTSPYQTEWFQGSTLLFTQTNLLNSDTINNLSSGSYSVVVTDANGCSAAQSFSISNAGGPSFSALNINPVACFGDSSGTGFSAVNGGLAPYAFVWTNSSGTVILNQPGSAGSSSVSGLPAGNYEVTVTDAAGCVSIQTFSILEPAAALSIAQVQMNQSTCGNSNGSISVVPLGGTPSYTYAWLPSGGNDSLAQNLVAGIYSLNLSDANGCSFDTTFVISNADGPQVQILQIVNPTCNGGNNGNASVQVTGGTPPYTYNWAGTVQGNTATATNLSSGNYSVTVSDANGCTQILPLSVNDVPGINFTTNAQGASCGNANGAASVTASGGTPPYSYAWSNGSSGSLITQIPAGNYSVIISDSLGCEMMAVITVGGSAGPLVNAGEDITIEAGQSVNLDAEIAGVINYSWAPPEGLSCIACPDPVATPDTTTLYIVTVTYNGCIGSDSVLITVDKKCGDIFVPSAFSPNNDGHNDLLYLRGTCIQNMYFKVYDRWGRLMFESTDPSKGWDGNFEGKPCIAGVYHYTAEVTVKGAILVEQGNVTLAR